MKEKTNAHWARQKRKEVSQGISLQYPVFIARAKNALLTDLEGKQYIDFAGGVGATNSGHGNPGILAAARKQLERFFHVDFTIAGYPGYVEVCRELNKIAPVKGKAKSALFNSGAEAVENAVKIARNYTGREAIVSFEHGFHGRTLLAMSLTSKIQPYKKGFGPFAPETYKLPYPYLYRRPADCQTEQGYVKVLLEQVENEFFTGVVEPENIAAVIMEPITGEGGFIVPPAEYVRGLAKICRKHGILFIADEVQTGFCRTGKMFCLENFGVKADLVTVAKSIANGLPLSGVTGKSRIMDSVQEGGIGGTFIGNPVACAASVQAIRFMKKQKLWKKAQQIGKETGKRFWEWQEQMPWVGDARGLGAMRAIELVKDKESKAPDKARTKRITNRAFDNGLLVLSAGILGNDVRTLMPLTIPKEQLHQGLGILEDAVKGK